MKIIPAILPQSYRAVESGVEKVKDVVDTVQIDFVDGYFAPNKTWWFNGKDRGILDAILREENGLPFWQSVNYEFDLMVKDPLQHIDTFIALGPSKIIFHLESLKTEETIHYFETLPEIVRETVKFGIAIGIETDPALLTPYLHFIESIQCMGIAQVGFQGQAFDERVFAQIKKVRELYPEKTVAVDGAITDKNIETLTTMGVTEFAVGSHIFQNINPHGTIKTLKQLCTAVITASEK